MLFRIQVFLVHYYSLAAVFSSVIQRPSQIQGTNSALLSAFQGNIASPARLPADTIPLEHLFPNQNHYPSNLSATTPSAACDGFKYGNDVKAGSCIGALEIIPDLERAISFGPRNQGAFMLGLYISIDVTLHSK